MIIPFNKTVVFRTEPVEDEEDQEETEDGGGGGGDHKKGGPSKDAAERRISAREERRRTEVQTTKEREKEREKERQEFERLQQFRNEAEPKLKLVDRLKDVFSGERGNEPPSPTRPDPYDPDYQAKMDVYEELLVQRAAERAESRALTIHTSEQRQREFQNRETARRAANDELVESFFSEDARRDWPQEKRNELLQSAINVFRIGEGPSGEFTKRQLLMVEREVFGDDVLARAQARGEDKIMGHLGAPKKLVVRKTGAKRTPDEIDSAAEDFLNRIERMSQGRQEAALDRLEIEDPEVYAYYIKALDEA